MNGHYMHEKFPTLVQGNGNENHREINFHTYLKGSKVQKTMSTVDRDVEQLELVCITGENENGRTTLENDLEVAYKVKHTFNI